jgi:hypothetical protein
MLTYLGTEQCAARRRASRDIIPAAPRPDDQGTRIRVAYEAARHVESERWIPARRRRKGARRGEVVA